MTIGICSSKSILDGFKTVVDFCPLLAALLANSGIDITLSMCLSDKRVDSVNRLPWTVH
jgi:hypothetical protein